MGVGGRWGGEDAYLRLGASSRLGAYSNKYGMWMLDSAKTLGILGGDRCAAPNPISDQKMSFSHQFSGLASIIHGHSQTWPLRNYVIIT